MGHWIGWSIYKPKDRKEVDLILMGAHTLGFADDIFTNKLKVF